MNSVSSVSLSVSQSVTQCSQNWFITFFLIFSVKLGDHKHRKVTEPDFSGKFSFGQKWGKRPQKGPKKHKNRVFGLLCKIESLVFARNDLKLSVLWLANFLRKFHIWENSLSRDLGQKGPKKGKNSFFGLLWKIESLVFARNGLK